MTPSTATWWSSRISTRNSRSPMVVTYLISDSFAEFSAVHAFPAPPPLPVAGVALAALDDVGRALGLLVGDQGRQDGGDIRLVFFAFLGGFHGEALFYKASVVLPGHKAVRGHQALGEGDIGVHADDPIL